MTRLAASVDGVGIERIGVGVQDSTGSGESSGGSISIAVILGAWAVGGRSVGELVESGGGLVLSVAAAGECWKSAVVEVAVGDHVLGWDSVCQDVA